MAGDQEDEAGLLWVQMRKHRPNLNDMGFCGKVESEAAWIQDILMDILNQNLKDKKNPDLGEVEAVVECRYK
jgi:hypothetical protein